MAEAARDSFDGASAVSACRLPEEAWNRVLGRLKSEIGDTQFRSWVRPICLQQVAEGQATLSAPTRFLRDWVATHYADRLLVQWRIEDRTISRVVVVVRDGNGAQDTLQEAAEGPQTDASPGAGSRPGGMPATPMPGLAEPLLGAIDESDDRHQLMPSLDPRLCFENFIVGKPNELAHAAARRVAEACSGPDHQVPFNRFSFMAASAWENASDARDRAGGAQPGAVAQGDLSLGRKVHVPVYPRAALQIHDGFQGAVPLGGSADDRRRAVHQRQGVDSGRVLPHLQRPGRPEPPGRRLGGQVAIGFGGAGGAHALPPRLGAGGGSASDDL